MLIHRPDAVAPLSWRWWPQQDTIQSTHTSQPPNQTKNFWGKKLQRSCQASFKPFCPDKVCRWNTHVDVCKVKDNSQSNGKGTVLFQFFSEMGRLLVANTTLHSLLFEPQMVLRYETRGTQYWYRAQPAPRAHPCKHQHLPGKGGELTKATSPGGWVSSAMTKLCDKL